MLCYPAQGCADGVEGDHVLLAPIYAVTTKDIDQIVDLTGLALRDTMAEVTENA